MPQVGFVILGQQNVFTKTKHNYSDCQKISGIKQIKRMEFDMDTEPPTNPWPF